MPVDIETVMTSLGVAAITSLGAEWLRGRNQRKLVASQSRQADADAADKIADAAGGLVERLSQRLDAVEADLAKAQKTATEQNGVIEAMRQTQLSNIREIAVLSDRVATLTTGVRILSAQIVEMGGQPRWQPPPHPLDLTG